MNKEEAIKYLQQIYPNGGHCWLDEQRIEAIGMAIKALQEESNKVKFNVGDTIKNKDGYEVTIESVGDDCYFVDKAQSCIKFSTQDQWELVEEPVSEDLEEAADKFVKSYTKGGTKQSWLEEGYIAGAKWQKEKMMTEAIDAHCFGFQGDALFSFKLPANNYLVGSKVKAIVIKED